MTDLEAAELSYDAQRRINRVAAICAAHYEQPSCHCYTATNHVEQPDRMKLIADLDHLREILNSMPEDETDRRRYARVYRLPMQHGDVDMSNLPTFGGTEPRDTEGIWSYDETRLLIGTSRPFTIVPRH